MPEYVDRVAIRDELYEADAITMKGVEILNKFPAADVVEVVRCKDRYKYFRVIGRDEREVWGCRHFGSIVKADDFCSYGERKDGTE